MKRLVVVGLAFATILAVAAACGPTPGVVTLRTEANGTSVTLQPGQTLKVTLPSNPSTGYSWQIASLPECLESAGESEFESEAEEGVVGAGGTETLTFEAVEAGDAMLELEYRRPWETGVEPADTFSADVTVTE